MTEVLTSQKLRRARLLIAGQWCDGVGSVPLFDVFTGDQIAEVSTADERMVADAIDALEIAFRRGPLEPSARAEALMQASYLVTQQKDALVDTIVSEAGFARGDAEGEVSRAVQTLIASADEARRLAGEVIPLAGAPGQSKRIGFTMRVPLGIVCAITPFNAPLNTVAHKIAPALAGGNAIIVKPASATPLTTQMLVEILIAAGFPADFLAIVNGAGSKLGAWLTGNQKIRFYTFTGSTAVGARIHAGAGLRRTQMELGSIAATILDADANVDLALPKIVRAGFRKAGQVCTSIQRLYIHNDILEQMLPRYLEAVKALRFGNPHDTNTDVGPMIDVEEAIRVKNWIDEALEDGATLLAGGERKGSVIAPTVLGNLSPEMTVMREEIFGPVVCIRPFDDLGAAINEINSTPYGLATGLFTQDITRALKAAQKLDVGGVHINETCSSRVDLMPYGGVKDSGFGREGPKYAIRELTEERLITISL